MKRFVVMGVSGCGKSVIGAALAEAMDATYIDGDDLHSASNIAKMEAGTPLTDLDRAPWLDQVGQTLHVAPGVAIVGCSALKRIYRDRIRAVAGPSVMFLHLDGSKALIAGRMGKRTGHFMPTTLLDSQFAALEPPAPDECALTVPIGPPPAEVVAFILQNLRTKAI